MSTPPNQAPQAASPPLWDVFCRVIDNLGDIGVCWRFCADLAQRGQKVRLWIDAPEALSWMAPGALEGSVANVEVVRWTEPLPPETTSGSVGQVWVEAFGCDPASEWLTVLAQRVDAGLHAPVWINLEYLSAEHYVERCHGLPSPIMSGPLSGQTKWFFYPGFTDATGGLLREADLLAQHEAFSAEQWLTEQSIQTPSGTRRVSLFCYEPGVLGQAMREAALDDQTSCWLITPGRAHDAVQTAVHLHDGASAQWPDIHLLPHLPQTAFDHLLWSCDLNFVRGEDSLVRALWAGQAFVWHLYPQDDLAHHAKLEAFLDWLEAPPSLRRFHLLWNGVESNHERVWPGWTEIENWRACAWAARQRLLSQPDLTAQLLEFIAKKR